MNKLRAFTLLELLVAMIISGIVLGSVLSALHILSEQQKRFEQNCFRDRDISFFASIFHHDYSLAENYDMSDHDIRFDSKVAQVTFHLYPGFVIRKTNNARDTFFVSVQSGIHSDDALSYSINYKDEHIERTETSERPAKYYMDSLFNALPSWP